MRRKEFFYYIYVGKIIVCQENYLKSYRELLDEESITPVSLVPSL